MNKVNKIIDDTLFEWIREIRRTIHQTPEIAYREEKTSEVIARTLKKLSIKFRTGIAGTGIAAHLDYDEKAPTVALRADIDALPIQEETGLSFSSQNPGMMHACGHDGHVAIVLGAAALLSRTPPEGNVVFLFQPAEEAEGGAKPMIEAGVLENVDMIFGGHITNDYRAGVIGIKRGVHTSFTDAFDIRITGRGGHAARPHEAVDALLIASQTVMGLQNIIARCINPVHPAVLTVGYLKAGTVNNAIAEKAVLKGTIRTTDDEVRNSITEKIRKMTSAMSILYDADIKYILRPGYPPVINEDTATGYAEHVAEKLLGRDNTVSILYPSLGGEDFAYFLQQVPGCFVRFGAAKEIQESFPSHSPKFDFDEEALRTGAAYLSELARFTIKKLRKG